MPVITDSSGKAEYAGEDFDFVFGDETEVKASCSVTYRGDFYVFGGYQKQNQNQISKLAGCSLKRIGSLDFGLYYGACAAVKEESIYLCFSHSYGKKCYIGANALDTFSRVKESQFDHKLTRIAANDGND